LPEQQAGGRHDVVDGYRGHLEVATGEAGDRERHLGIDGLESDRWIELVRNPREVRPGIVVEQVLSNAGEHPLGAVDRDRFRVRAEDVFDEKR